MHEKTCIPFLLMYTRLKFVQGDYYMNNKNTGMIATIAAVVLCGCPGLFLCLFGAVTSAGMMPYTTEVNGVSSSGTLPVGAGLGMLCFALIFILIPVGVGFFTMRKKPGDVVAESSEPTPPTAS
jgi:hypothetical protein